jgi:uncharacterized membrane protein
MSTLSIKTHEAGAAMPGVRRVEAARPFLWLRRGWHDMTRSWPWSLGLGIAFTGLGWLLLEWVGNRAHLAMTLTTGFLLVAPFLAIGFYCLSRRLEQKRAPRGIFQPFSAIRRNAGSIGMFALMLAFILSAWERISALLVGLFLKNDIVALGYFSLGLLFDGSHTAFVIAYLLFGAVLAVLVFALSVVSLPMMLDRRVDIVTAIMTSLSAVRDNPAPMLVWAVSIAVLAVFGVATWLVGLIVVFPLLGHATWHAYRDLVEKN